MILVLGAGLAGLSTALHLDGAPFRVVERESDPGGLARSVDAGGFLFDFTGHLLHLRSERVARLCDDLLGGDQVRLERSAWIHYRDALVEYPFQVNTAGLPVDVRVDCVKGFAESLLAENRLPPGELLEPRPEDRLPLSFLNVKEPRGGYAASFKDWAIATFGPGFARHFFLAYNQKNFACDLATLSSDWVSWAIPKPTLDDVLRGALGHVAKEFGYNPRFRYPASGGIRRLPDAMARRLAAGGHPIETGVGVDRIDAPARVAHLSSGETVRYDALVATLPLPELFRLAAGLDPLAERAVADLRWCAVASFNFGVRGAFPHRRHWVYFPEPEFRFYRVGYPAHLTPAMAPDGMTSICAEVAYPAGGFPPDPGEEDRVVADLLAAGVLDDPRRIAVRRRLDLPYAYVLFDDVRRRVLPIVFRALLAHRIIPVGRYGSWSYLSMEDTILQGIETAEWLKQNA